MTNLSLRVAAFVVNATLAIASVTAFAADLPVKALPAAAPPFSWTGFYIGAHAGGGVLLDQGYSPQRLLADRHGLGALAGGQLGANYQVGMFVVGIEGEGFWSGMKVTRDQFINAGQNANLLGGTASIRNAWDFDLAGRFGIAIERALIYGKAGWVSARFDWNSMEFNCSTHCIKDQGSGKLDGLLIGIGLEYAFINNWTAKFEYDYLGFGAKNVVFTSTCLTPGYCVPSDTFTHTQSVSADKHVFKVGLNYLFNPGAMQ